MKLQRSKVLFQADREFLQNKLDILVFDFLHTFECFKALRAVSKRYLKASTGSVRWYPTFQAIMLQRQREIIKGMEKRLKELKKMSKNGPRALPSCIEPIGGLIISALSKISRETLVLLAEGGDTESMVSLGRTFSVADRRRWIWWGRAACSKKQGWAFLSSFVEQVDTFKLGAKNSAVVFAIGRGVKTMHSVNALKLSECQSLAAREALHFFSAQLIASRKAVDCWTFVALHFGVVKDIRLLIAKIIWEAREEALFSI